MVDDLSRFRENRLKSQNVALTSDKWIFKATKGAYLIILFLLF